jgi:minor extracellular serine protease Vpr
MKKGVSWLLLIALLAISLPAVAQEPVEPLVPPPSAETGEMVNETPSLWFVELAGKPVADGGSARTLKSEKQAFRAEAAKAGLKFTERYAFDTLWNGLSIQIEPGQLGLLARLPGVKAIYPNEPIAMPQPTTGDPELFTSLAMIGADVVQSELGYTGAGIKVAVMDTGIDYDHPDLGGCFGPGCRVAYGYDFVGDDFTGENMPVPDPYPDDCNGHGTHVSGIIGADGVVTGVAPEVTFGAYRVFGCTGYTWADIMIAAMERALADKMDVLNMSIGSAFQWPQYPTAQASDRMVNRGMVVVASIGNSGANGLYSAGAPGLGEKVIGVASFDNTEVYVPYFEVKDAPIGYIAMTFSGPVPTSGTEEIVYIGQACDADLPLLADPAGKVALAVRGACAFAEKATNAIDAGAVGVVIHNSAPGLFSGTLGAPIDGVTPVVGISQADGLFIRAQEEPVYMTWTAEMVSAPNPTGGLISSFSSYGLSPDLAFKPDIGAPGGNIYSTYPLEGGGYATLSGTSMSSPHVAGAVALLLEAKPKTKAWEVRDILQNSAEPKNWWGNPGLGFLDNVHRQGAGMLQIDEAIEAIAQITPAKIAAGESEAGPYKTRLAIRNNTAKPVTFDLSYVNALSTGGVITPSFYGSNAKVEFDKASVTVPGGGVANVWATIHPATGPVNGQYGGYILFTPQGGGQVYRVPFAGFVGDYQGIQVLTPTTYGFPWLAISYMGSFYGPVMGPDDWVYSMAGEDIPYFLVHFEHQPQLFTLEVFEAYSGKSMFWAFQEEYLPRNSTTTGFFAFPWDGTTTSGKEGKAVFVMPDGDYVVELSVLKALGNKNNPDHWEKWTSPVIRIERP